MGWGVLTFDMEIFLPIHNQELLSLTSACRPVLVNISIKFHKDILNGFKVIARTRFCHRNCYLQSSSVHNSKIYIKGSWFLCSARRPVLVSISLTFHENVLKGFNVIERTRFCRWNCCLQNSKEHNSKFIYPRLMVLMLCTLTTVG